MVRLLTRKVDQDTAESLRCEIPLCEIPPSQDFSINILVNGQNKQRGGCVLRKVSDVTGAN